MKSVDAAAGGGDEQEWTYAVYESRSAGAEQLQSDEGSKPLMLNVGLPSRMWV